MARDLGSSSLRSRAPGREAGSSRRTFRRAAENGGAATKEAPEKGEAEEPAEAKAEAPAKGDKKGKKKDKKAEEKAAKKEPQKAEVGVKGEVQVEELTRLQQTVSRRMAESKATAPDFSIALTVDMTAVVELRPASRRSQTRSCRSTTWWSRPPPTRSASTPA